MPVADRVCQRPRLRVRPLRLVEPVDLAQHARHPQPRRHPILGPVPVPAHPLERLQHIQRLLQAHFVLEVVRVREQRGEQEPHVVRVIGVRRALHHADQVARLGPVGGEPAAGALRGGVLIMERGGGGGGAGGGGGPRGGAARGRRSDNGKRGGWGGARRGRAGRSPAGRQPPPAPAARRTRCRAWRPPGGAGIPRAASCTGPAPTRSSCPQNSVSAAFPPAGAAKTPYRPAWRFHIVTAVETPTAPPALELRRREVLRQASVALSGRVVALWEVSPSAEVVPILASAAAPRPADTRLDLETTLHRWSAPIIQGSRWVGCRLDNGDGGGPWCVAPVRQQPPAPPPDGVGRRSRGLLDHPVPTTPPRRPAPDAVLELAPQPAVIAHEVANPLTAALAALDLTRELVREADTVDPAFRATLLDELAGVSDGMDQAIQFLRSIQDRARGTLARSERFDAAQVVRSCVALERPLARQRGVALQGLVSVSNVFLQGDPNALYQVLTNLIRNAVAASLESKQPVVVTLEQTGELLHLSVADRGVGIPAEHLERIFEPGFTTREFGSGSGTGLTVVSQITRDMFGDGVEVRSTVRQGATFTVNLPIPPQRTPRRR